MRQWCGVGESSVSDGDLDSIIAAELDIQAKLLRLPDDSGDGDEATYPAPLARSLLRRVQREIAARQVPLGMIGDAAGEYGAAYLRTWDPEIRRLEDPYRIPVVS